LALTAAVACQHQLLKDSCQSSCQDVTVQRLGDCLQVPDNGLQNLAERFTVPGAAQARNVLSSVGWEGLFEVMFQKVAFFL